VNGSVILVPDGSFTYTPNADFCGIDDFTYTILDSNGGSGTAMVNIEVDCVNDPPVATDDEYTADEDATLNISAPGLLDNDSDVDGDTLTVLDYDTSGTLGSVMVNSNGSFSYNPNGQFENLAAGETATDTFWYTISDGNDANDSASVAITIHGVNDAPVLTVEPSSVDVQYSDAIMPVAIAAEDIDSSSLTISVSGLPDGMTLSAPDCSGNEPAVCSASISGYANVPAGTYTASIEVSDGEVSSTAQVTINVAAEKAKVEFGDDNPVAVLVAKPGGNSGTFDLLFLIREFLPDNPTELALPGDISLAQMTMLQLVPVGPGSPLDPGSCTPTVTGSGYDGVLAITCSFDGVPVNTYTVEVSVGGGYYEGYGEDVLVVYDPSLGFTTGGGWFYWPGSEDPESGYPGNKTNFGYTMKYNKKGTNIQGSLLLIRHLPDGSIYRVKSNALYGLALGESGSGDEIFGWASFGGKSTYLEPDWPEPVGNHEFLAYVEDRNEPGTGIDRFWIQVRDKDGVAIEAMSMAEPAVDNATEINGGNVVVPHGGGGKRNPF
jgi:VCBS repeat-containing protein